MTLARQKLKKFIILSRLKKITQKDIADGIKCSCSYLSELLSGIKIAPSIQLAGRIESYTKSVKVGDWNKQEIEE